MSIEDYFVDYLFNRGMFENQAKEVMEMVKERNKEMAGRWGDNIQYYPKTVLSLLTFSVNEVAVEWIDKNLPKAWNRDVFVAASSKPQGKYE